MALNLHTGEEFMALTPPTYLYLVTPLVPTGGTIFLYGKFGIGKSPFTWTLANAVATGQSFLGMPTSKANVAYVDVDTPWHMVQQRWKEVNFKPQFVIVEGQAFDCLRFGSNLESYKQPYEALTQCRRQFDPKLVIINTLMKIHDTTGKNPNLPKEVYSKWQQLFPDAAILFIHHDKKDVWTGDEGISEQQEDESFSGYQEWINHCNVAIHLVKQPHNENSFILKQTKDQGSGKIKPMPIHLRDGFFLDMVAQTNTNKQQIMNLIKANPNEPRDVLAKRVASSFGVPILTARKLVDEV